MKSLENNFYNNKIAVLLPFTELLGFAKEIAQKMQIEIYCEKINSANVTEVAEKVKNQGIEFIVSRGNLGKIIREATGITVVNIKFNDYEYMKALDKYKDKKLSIAVVENNDMIEGIMRVNEFYNLNIHYYKVNSIDMFHKKTMQAVEDGHRLIIGGSWGAEIRDYLSMYDVEYEMVESTRSSLETAIKNAISMIALNKRKDNDKRLLTNIIEYYNNAVIVTNEKDNILYYNKLAENFMINDAVNSNNRELKTILPMFKNVNKMSNQLNVRWKGIEYHVNIIFIMMKNNIQNKIIFINEKSHETQTSSQKVRRRFQEHHGFDNLYSNNIEATKLTKIAKIAIQSANYVLFEYFQGAGAEILAKDISDCFNFQNCIELDFSLDTTHKFNMLKKYIESETPSNYCDILLIKNSILINDKQKNILEKLLKYNSSLSKEKAIKVIIFNENSNKDNSLFDFCDTIKIEIPHFNTFIKDKKQLFEALTINYDCDIKRCMRIYNEIFLLVENFNWKGQINQFNQFAMLLINLIENNMDDETILEILKGNLKPSNPQNVELPLKTLAEIELDAIKNALEKFNGNKQKTAAFLGIDRSTLSRKIKLHNI